jgi:hydroxymethylpyrimidine pyrophosphatase-like HAD family hydrolase/energy-coupling factor transporter ATP-binding protein EcfA2
VRYLILATDYDGTLAHDGVVDEATIAALERFRASGGRPILVTGRELTDLERVFNRFELFDRLVVENGGVIVDPSTHRQRVLGPAIDPRFVAALRDRGVAPLSIGRTIAATVEPHERTALDVIKALGLELHVIFNKGAVMVLPSGVNKATGLCAALEELGLSPRNVAGVGDAENDHAFLDVCELSVAVANAIPSLKEHVDLVTTGARGFGVQELIGRLLARPPDAPPSPRRHWLPIGSADGAEVSIEPYGRNVLISGPSGSGKSTLTNTLLEQLADRRYQFCLIDPEGDYEAFSRAIRIGGPHALPPVEEVIGALQRPDQNVIVSLTGIPKAERPLYFASLLPRVQEMRARSGRPHWILIDEAHHVLPAEWRGADSLIPLGWTSLAMVTLEPQSIASVVRNDVSDFVAVGEVLPALAQTLVEAGFDVRPERLVPGSAKLYTDRQHPDGVAFAIRPAEEAHRRHRRKYAEGSLPPDAQFVFTGPDHRLNLPAENLSQFLKLAEGIDEATWTFHLRRGDFSQWFRRSIKDEDLAIVASSIEADAGSSRAWALDALRRAVEERYT